MAVTSHGRIDEFQQENESIEAYLERVDLYFAANDIAEGKRVAVFLSVIGGKTYTLLRNLLAPAKLGDLSLSELKGALKKHFEPKRVVIAERFHFYRRNQAAGESIADFVAELRRLSTHCAFGENQLEEALRDRLVCGLRSEAIQRRLLTVTNLTFAEALQTAQGMEAADKNTQQLKGTDIALQFVGARPTSSDAPRRTKEQKRVCYRCGKSNHQSTDCRFKDTQCHFCGKLGHIASVCRSKQKAEQSHKKTSRRQKQDTKWVQFEQEGTSAEESDTDSIPVLQIGRERPSAGHPITVEMVVNNKPLVMELDTGAAVSVISEQTQRRLFPQTTLKPTSVLLRTYTGEPMTVAGEMTVNVQYRAQSCTLPLLVVAGNGPTLFGRDWRRYFELEWKSMGLAALDGGQARVQVLLHNYPDVFAETLGKMEHHRATL